MHVVYYVLLYNKKSGVFSSPLRVSFTSSRPQSDSYFAVCCYFPVEQVRLQTETGIYFKCSVSMCVCV